MSKIELQVVGKDFKYFFVRNKGSTNHWKQTQILHEIKSALKLQEIFEQDLIDWEASCEMKAECGTAMIQKPRVKAIFAILKDMKERSEK